MSIRELQSSIRQTHAELLQNVGFDDNGVELGHHVRNALAYLETAHVVHSTGGTARNYFRNIEEAHGHLDDMRTVTAGASGNDGLTDSLQEGISALY
jgi:hypothetical protein